MFDNIEEAEEKMRIPQGPTGTRKVPLEIERLKTNFPYLVSMGVYLVVWLGIAIFAGVFVDLDFSFNGGRGINEPMSEARGIVQAFSAFTALMSFSYILLMKRFAKILVFATITIFCSLLVAVVCIFLFLCTAYKSQFQIYLAGLIVSLIILIPTIISVIVLRRKIQNAIEVIRVSSKIVSSFPFSLLFSILPCILYGIVMIFSQRTMYNLLTENPYSRSECSIFLHLFNVFGFLWFMSFITGWSQTVLSGCFCSWYWTLNKYYVTNYATIFHLVLMTTKYHLGTIACGSLMIVLRKLIRLLLNTLGRLYILLDVLLGYKLLFGKIKKFLKYVNHDAYIMTSSHGTDFFKSAKDAFNLRMRNVTDTLMINRIAEAILILGQILIIIISALATYGYCTFNNKDLIPAAVSLIIVSGIVITASIFMVLKTAIDSIWFCILKDKEENSSIHEKTPFMSTDLKAPFLRNVRNI